MLKTMPSLDDLTKTNPKVDTKQIAELNELARRLQKVPMGKQKSPSPIGRRYIVIGSNNQPDPRTVYLTTRR